MNYTVVPARKSCDKCGNIQSIESKYCQGCGISFVVGQPNAWESEPLVKDNAFGLGDEDIEKLYKELEEAIYPEIQKNNTTYTNQFEYPCLHDDVEPGAIMGVVCNCPRCSIR